MTNTNTPIATVDIAEFTGKSHAIVLQDFLTMLEVMPEDFIYNSDYEEVFFTDPEGNGFVGYFMDADLAETLTGHYGDAAAMDALNEHLDALDTLGCACPNCVAETKAMRWMEEAEAPCGCAACKAKVEADIPTVELEDLIAGAKHTDATGITRYHTLPVKVRVRNGDSVVTVEVSA